MVPSNAIICGLRSWLNTFNWRRSESCVNRYPPSFDRIRRTRVYRRFGCKVTKAQEIAFKHQLPFRFSGSLWERLYTDRNRPVIKWLGYLWYGTHSVFEWKLVPELWRFWYGFSDLLQEALKILEAWYDYGVNIEEKMSSTLTSPKLENNKNVMEYPKVDHI